MRMMVINDWIAEWTVLFPLTVPGRYLTRDRWNFLLCDSQLNANISEARPERNNSFTVHRTKSTAVQLHAIHTLARRDQSLRRTAASHVLPEVLNLIFVLFLSLTSDPAEVWIQSNQMGPESKLTRNTSYHFEKSTEHRILVMVATNIWSG